MTFQCKDPEGPPTKRQTFALYCATGKDFRPAIVAAKMNRQAVSDLIGAANQLSDEGQTKAEVLAYVESQFANK